MRLPTIPKQIQSVVFAMDKMDKETWASILPPGLGVVDGPSPPPPTDFDVGYSLPEHTVKPLSVASEHDNDKHLIFYEKPHIYAWKGVPTTASVTSLAHEYETPFIAVEVIGRMKNSRAQMWPRKEYTLNATELTDHEQWTHSKGALLYSLGKTIGIVQPFSMEKDSNTTAMLQVLQASVMKGSTASVYDNDAEIYVFARAKTDSEIMLAWEKNGMLASHKGTEAHFQAELFFNGLPCRWWEPEIRIVLEFARSRMAPRGIVAFATEKEIVCPAANLAGSIDLIVYEPSTGLYHIIDHKRSEKLNSQLRGYGKMSHPFTHIEDCKGAGYALQTSIYQYILEREYGLKIGERILLSLHPDARYPGHINKEGFATRVPYLKDEVEFIMNKRYALVSAQSSVAKEDPVRFKCELTGAPAVDAVRLKGDGRLAMEKAALVHNLDYTIDYTTRETFGTMVEERMDCVVFESKGARVSWRRMMPSEGIPPLV